MGEAIRIPREVPDDAAMRLKRLRGLAWLLDRSVGVGEKARFGIDPIIGLIPVVGDWVAAMLSLYVVYEAMRLGIPRRVLWRMLANVGIEALVGAVPVLGDAFDFVWQANTRNLRLVEQNYNPRLTPRSTGSIGAMFGTVVLVVVVFTIGTLWFAIWLMNQLIERYWPT